MEERVELHIMFLVDPMTGTRNGMFTIYLNGTRIVGVDPKGFRVEKEVIVTVSRKELLDILDAGELHPPPETQYTYINLLESEDLEALKTDGNASQIDGVLARRKAKEDLTQAFKNALAAGCVIWPTSCTCGGRYAWLTPGEHGGHTMYGCICHNPPPDYVDDYKAINLVNHTNPEFEEYNKQNAKPPHRFTLGHLQALYEYIFRAGMPRAESAADHGYWSMSNAYWHGRQGGRFIESIAQPGTCAHAAYQAGYDTGVRGQFEKGVGPIADVARYFEFEKERATWHCGECEKPWSSFKEAHACCADKMTVERCGRCGADQSNNPWPRCCGGL